MMLSVFIVGILAIVALYVLSAKSTSRLIRRISFSAALLLTVAIVGGGGFILLASSMFWEASPPSLATLAKQYAERRAGLDHILAMSNEDPDFGRIAPSFMDASTRDGKSFTQAMRSDPKSPLSSERWSQYQSAFDRVEAKEGIMRDEDGNLFVMAGTVGLLNRGYATGYLYCRDQGSTGSQASSFEPCALAHQDAGSMAVVGDAHTESYAFKRVSDHWFVYKQGPS